MNIDQLHKNWQGQEGFACLTVLPGASQTFFHWPREANALHTAFDKANSNANAYVTWALFAEPTNRLASNAKIVPGVLLDIDLNTGKHAAQNYANSADEALALLPLKPSRVVNSGGGLYAHFLFPSAFVIETETDRERVSSALRNFEALTAEKFAEAGFKLDRVADLSRITRPVGSHNHKYAPTRLVTLVEENDIRYSIETIEALVAAEVKPRKPVRVPSSAFDASGGFSLVEKHCAVVAGMASKPAEVTEPVWYAVATVAAKCDGGSARFHELSALDQKRYSPIETDSKLEQAGKVAPRTCDGFMDLGCTECERCPFRAAGFNSPVALAHGDPQLLELQATHVLDIATQRYYPGALSRDAFDAKYAHRTKALPHGAFIRDNRSPKVDRVDYLPGNSQLIANGALNTWEAGGVEAKAGDCDILLEHFAKLLPNEEERNWALDYVAHLVQHPAIKINSAVVLVGGQGIGKTAVGTLMSRLLGSANVYSDTAGVHASPYLAPLGNRQLVIFEEMATDSKWEVANSLKPLITEDEIHVTQKYVAAYPVRTPRGIWVFTNHASPTVLESDDRRYAVLRSDMVKPEQSYFDRLFGDGMKQAGAFKHFLLGRDISHWSPHAKPPETEAKRAAIEQSRTNTAMMVEDYVSQRGQELITTKELSFALNPPGQAERHSVKQLTRAFNELGYRQLQKTKLSETESVRPWATENHSHWLAADHNTRKAFYDTSRRKTGTGNYLSLVSSSSVPAGST